MVSLDGYRERRNQHVPTIEIKLKPGGAIEYSTAGVDELNAFQALIGCYAVAGKLLETLRENMKCGTGGGRGTSE